MPAAVARRSGRGAVGSYFKPHSVDGRPQGAPTIISSCRAARAHYQWDPGVAMAVLDTISIGILLGALLVLAGIMSSLVAMRFGAPLLLVFLIVGMAAGEAGPGHLQFDDVRS